MNKRGENLAGPFGEPAPASADSLDGLTLRLRPIDDAPPPSRVPPRKPPAPAPDAAAQSLTTFDWLETIVSDVVLASENAAAPLAGSFARPAPSQGASWLATNFAAAHNDLDGAVLSQVVLGYSPLIDRKQGVIATRFTVVPMRTGARLDVGSLLDAVAHAWPADGGAVALNVSSESLLNDLLRAQPSANIMIEVPAFIAAEPANVEALCALAARGNTLLLKGRPTRELPRAVLPCFTWSLVDFADDRRLAGNPAPTGINRTIPHIQTGVRTHEELRLSFERGALAVMGWPMREPVASNQEARPDLQVVMEMINRIDRNETAEAIQRPLLRDPVLAYELMCQVNAAVAGPMQLETGSFQHAVSMLGHQQLRRWLATVLQRTGDGVSLRPVNFAALRRGLLMRLLSSSFDNDAQTRGELFMCGVFSLLDRVYARPIEELLAALSIPDRVAQALLEGRGPFHPLLELVRAIESEVPHEIRAAAAAAFIAPAEINHALLRTLRIAADLERDTGASGG